MQFDHLVEVNGSDAPFVLNREELWVGLMCRAEDARPFLPGLECCRIVERQADMLMRELHFGQSLVRDKVCWHPSGWICFEADATQEHAGGSLTISIEEPEEGRLFLRFRYLLDFPETGDDADIVRSAYRQSGFDTLRVIREMASSRKQH